MALVPQTSQQIDGFERPPISKMDNQFLERDNLEKHGVDYDTACELGNVPKIGMTFGSEDDAYEFYNKYAKAAGFSIRKHHRYIRKSDNKLEWRELCCSCQGERKKHSKKGTPIKSRPQTRFNCEAYIRIEEVAKGSEDYVVTQLVMVHTHLLAPPDKAHMLRSHRGVRPAQKELINSMTAAGIGASVIYHYIAQENGGYNKVNFSHADLDNMVQRSRTEFLKKGDGMLLLDYFRKKKEENSSFEYRIQVDEDTHEIRNVFWCDAKSMIDYECFGDCVCYDTTFNTNTYEMPFSPFVGVNHHGQTSTFACALTCDETIETFVWVFKCFLDVMGGKTMKTIFTDQAPAIANAIKQVFPNVHHRLCVWHICQNALRNLSHVFTEFTSFSDDFTSCIYGGEVEEDFLKNWDNLLAKYNFGEEEKEWMEKLFEKKEKWAQVYGRQHFCAGMASTQRSESMNNYFKKYFKRKQVLSEFMKKFDKAMELRRKKEDEADLKSSQTVPNLVSAWVVERSARDFYTRKMFSEFQTELNKLVDLGANNLAQSDDSPIVMYDVEFYNTGRVRRVEFVRSANKASCSCQMFEFTGIPCAHMLKVWRMLNVKEIPSEYFLTRWSKGANPNITLSTSGNILEVDTNIPLSERFSELSHMAQTLVTLGSMTNLLAEVAKRGMKRVIAEVEACRTSTDPNIEDHTLVVDERMVEEPQDHRIVIAPPPKKLKGPKGRIKGLYDKLKKKRACKGKKSIGKNGRDGIEEVVRNSPPTKRRKKDIYHTVSAKKGKEVEEEKLVENPSIQNNGVEMASQYISQPIAGGVEGYSSIVTTGIQGTQFSNVEFGDPQVSFSYQQLLADQCSRAKKLNF